jgi:hypothetical protein
MLHRVQVTDTSQLGMHDISVNISESAKKGNISIGPMYNLTPMLKIYVKATVHSI